MKKNYPTLCTLAFLLLVTISTAQKIINVPAEHSTILKALMSSKRGDTVMVAPGLYKEQITIPSGVSLVATTPHKAIIDGKGRGNTINMSNNSSIVGMDITNGTAAIVTKSPGISIVNCRIYKNNGSAILCTGNLPEIKNCLIVFNQGSGIQAVSITGGSTILERNTISYNMNTGITISGKTGITIKNNIISNNSSQGIRLEELTENLCKVSNNIFFKNHRSKINIPKSNIEVNPEFVDPKRKSMNFSLKSNSGAKGKADDGTDPGFTL